MNASSKPTDRTAAMGLTEEARKSMNAAFDALSDWRNELATTTERNTSKVFDKMAAAAKSVGWPAEFVDQTRKQMQTASKMQLQMIDQVMDVWEQQMKAPAAGLKLPAFPAAAFTGFGSFPGFGANPFAANPFAGTGFDFNQLQMAPFQFWAQAAEMWQKSMMQAMTGWTQMMERPQGLPHASQPLSNGRAPLSH